MSQKKYVIRHKDVPSLRLSVQYANTPGEWYYCERGVSNTGGVWRHRAELQCLIVGSLDKIGQRYNSISTNFYKEGALEIVELTDQLSEELLFSKLCR